MCCMLQFLEATKFTFVLLSRIPLAAFAHTLLILMARGVPGQDNGLARSMAYVSYMYGKQL